MSARQLIVLAIAAIAAVGALFLIRGLGAREPQPEAAAPIAGEQVLVAARDIGQGAALTPSDIGVAVFPEQSVASSFVRVASQPSAQSEYVGAVTRRAFAAGEPITTTGIIQPEGRGFMAAQLEPGHRAFAISIEPETSAGGYIHPNDRVDVIVTTRGSGDGGGGEQAASNIVVENVRVLAMGDQTQPQTSGAAPEAITAQVAVLEMTPDEARAVALAERLGEVHLALRGVQAETVGLQTRSAAPRGNPGAVRVHAFGSIVGGGQ